MALLSAMLLEGPNSELVDPALENALEGTDHTGLVFNLTQMATLLLRMAADGRGEPPESLLRELAAVVEASIQGQDHDPQADL